MKRVGIMALREDIQRTAQAHLRLVRRRNEIEVHHAADVTGMQAVPVEQAAKERDRLVGVQHEAA